MEYCGEVITPDQFEERKKQYTNEKRRHYYFMSLRSDEVHVQCRMHAISGLPSTFCRLCRSVECVEHMHVYMYVYIFMCMCIKCVQCTCMCIYMYIYI